MSAQPAKFWHISLFGSRILGYLVVALVAGAGVWAVAKFWTAMPVSRPSRPPGRGYGSVAATSISPSGDSSANWPQWRGPDRNDVSRETGLLRTWPGDGPKLLWAFTNAGLGFSGPAIVGGRLFTMGAYSDKEYVYAIDAGTGKELWSAEIGPMFLNGWGDGPRGTPTVDGNRVYAISGQGGLICVEADSGAKVWLVDLHKNLGGETPSWGFAESPLVDGNQVVCTPGASQGALAALDKQTGKVLWRSEKLTDPAAYSSIVVAEVGGLRQYIQMTADQVVGVAAADGRLLWRSNVAHNNTAVISTPIVHQDHVYVTTGYGAGCGLLKLSPDGKGTKAETVYTNKVMKNQHGGVVLVDDHVYGYSEGSGWVCQEFKTGKSVWESKKLGKGSLTVADGRLYCYTEDKGTVVLAEAGPGGWTEHGRFTIPNETGQERKKGQIWTHPVVAGGRLYLRDQDLIFCYDVKNGS
jgi:outer membrane protein assembly factor BamB